MSYQARKLGCTFAKGRIAKRLLDHPNYAMTKLPNSNP
jgi:hypothetical protein